MVGCLIQHRDKFVFLISLKTLDGGGGGGFLYIGNNVYSPSSLITDVSVVYIN